MILAVWELMNLSTVANDIIDVLSSVSPSTALCVLGLIIIAAFAWRSTDVANLPPVPRPPYVIQITSSSTLNLNNNGERTSLSDVRLLSSGLDVENVLRRFPSSNAAAAAVAQRVRLSETRIINLPESSLSSNSSSANSGNNSNSNGQNQSSLAGRTNIRLSQGSPGQVRGQVLHQSYTNAGQNHGVSPSSLLSGILRPGSVIQPFINRATSGNQTQNLVVYHRVNVYHHHHHHHTSTNENETQTSSTSTPTAAAENLDNQSEINSDASAGENNHNLEDILTQASSEQISPSSPEITTASDLSEGLRYRRTAASSSPTISQNSDSCTLQSSSPQENMTSPQGGEARPAQSSSTEEISDIRFTIKFLNDTQMEVISQAGEKVADFKRRLFAAELSENKTVRLIFNGRVLDNDTKTLRESGIFDQCVVHCLIVSRPSATTTTSSGGPNASPQRGNVGLFRTDPGSFFVGVVGVLIIFLWFVCFHFGPHLFTQSAVISLTVLTAIFLIGLVAFYVPHTPPQAQ